MRSNDRTRQDQAYFQGVTAAYSDLRELSPLVACNLDDTAPTRRRTPVVSEFICDVELATRRVLKTPELFRAWEQIVAGETIPTRLANIITGRCGAIYRRRGLIPSEYFRTIKRRAGERVEAAA
jgi:hypothetical protein